MKKYFTWVPVLKFSSVVLIEATIIYVMFSILTYKNPYENLKSKISIENNKIRIKDFSIKVYPTNGQEIVINAEKFESSMNEFGIQSFYKVHTSIK